MDGKMTHSITMLKNIAKDYNLTEAQINAIFDAIDLLREYNTELMVKQTIIDSLGENYIFNAATPYGEGWNAATRGILNLLDPDKERYKRGASA